jgi:hypothetical protein
MLVEKKNEKTMLTDQAYAFGKRLVQLILPAISALYFGLGKIWGFPSVEQVVGSIAVISAFLGALLRVSSSQYDASGAAYDGHVTVTPNDEGTSVRINLDPNDLVDKKAITLKVNPPILSDS